jgi:hypothetical protein
MDVPDMLIAQLPVAGEEHTRSENLSDLHASEDREALDQFACDRTNLPWVIFRAAHRATHMSALPARARNVLAALARTVDSNRPYAAIFARRELLTGRAMQSMRTFYRSLDDLETLGFVVRAPQTRYGEAGLFGRAYLYLTSKAARLLGLDHSADSDLERDRSAVSAEDAARPSLATPSATVADRAIYKDLIPNHQKRQPGQLPLDLERLRNLGFRDFLIFKLMREARGHAKRLSDVVEASWDHLRRASHPISYLRALLRTPVDFGHRVQTKRRDTIQHTKAQREDDEAKAAANDLAGQHFVSHDELRTYVVADDASSVTVTLRDESMPRVQAGNWIPTFLAALRRGHIRPIPQYTDTIDCRQAQSSEPFVHQQTARDVPLTPRHAPQAALAGLRDIKAYLRSKQMPLSHPERGNLSQNHQMQPPIMAVPLTSQPTTHAIHPTNPQPNVAEKSENRLLRRIKN